MLPISTSMTIHSHNPIDVLQCKHISLPLLLTLSFPWICFNIYHIHLIYNSFKYLKYLGHNALIGPDYSPSIDCFHRTMMTISSDWDKLASVCAQDNLLSSTFKKPNTPVQWSNAHEALRTLDPKGQSSISPRAWPMWKWNWSICSRILYSKLSLYHELWPDCSPIYKPVKPSRSIFYKENKFCTMDLGNLKVVVPLIIHM